MRAAAIVWVTSFSMLVVGCGDDTAAGAGGGGGSPGTGGSVNQAPSVVGLEPAMTFGEGQTATRFIEARDPEGAEVAVTVETTPGLAAELTASRTLAIHADLGTAAGDVDVTVTDPEGATSTTTTSVTLLPLAWTETVQWDAGDGPEAREHASVLVDDASGSIYVMFGSGYAPYLEPLGDAWRFDVNARTWSEVSLEGNVPPPGGSKRLAGARGTGVAWLFGGYGADQELSGELYEVEARGDVLRFDLVAQENAPSARALHVFALDPGTGTFVLHGGASTRLEGDTWTMRIDDGIARWTQIHPTSTIPAPGLPAPRFGAFHGMDEERGRLLLFSGQTGFPEVFGQDTWVLDVRAEGGPTWSPISPPGSPPGRRNGTSVWDPTGPRLFVFGGTSDGATSQPGLFALDARPGLERWEAVDRDGQPPMRSSGFGAYANDLEQPLEGVWMGFGNDDDVYQDLARLWY